MSGSSFTSNEARTSRKDEAPVESYSLQESNDGNATYGQTETTESGFSIKKFGRLALNLGFEKRGIERVPEDERTDGSMIQTGTLWFSANLVVSSFAIGALGVPIFNLGFVDAALTIIFINILGIMPVCFFSTLGPKFGLRQMVLSRFYFGYYPVKIVALFNIMACVGWAAVNAIVGAQFFHAVNPAVPGWAGILAISVATLLICTFGYRIVHLYEKFSWIAMLIMFFIVLGVFAASGDFNPLLPLATGPVEAGSVLSFAASIFGFATGWTSFAADYTVYQPATRSSRSVFAWTFAGLFTSLCFTQLLGAAVATAMAPGAEGGQRYTDAYASAKVGGLLSEVLVPRLGGFGQFCLVLLGLSTVGNNCPNMYSAALSVQLLSARWAARVPRALLTLLCAAASLGIAIGGYDHFESTLESFMLIIGYWLAVYEGVALTEHFAFRRADLARYGPVDDDEGAYQDPGRLPRGFAAVPAACLGAAGAVLGMHQEWYTGPVGSACAADIGFELAFGFAAVGYLAFRPLEKAVCRR
ncbi:permease for cytosine/purines, uracil, thiamine, allantoin-domain-containing protein [Hypoxylon sp. FL1284]|nr:permease for cytosine/purines, uracil, thiamine, allantoin-domain-containing protein [Hypoxylon sp. FL1284]